ncbi:Dinitrogenase iron-molybdenum cofactor biosynthesis protein [Halorhabdus utahensis DSM 12940]|uniref:Dinitrogenase iron-molybdenum cofactor biosynthesis protein n=2 Tax=Halorhabdus utahensis TaxID=146826 RepID=C7NSA2_HALUD|nr:Dinitrogenase iron-molybdenum cofactor biosynthesis protein [Halorhabdus utahensis DSM 12940]
MTICMPITDGDGLDASVSHHFGRAPAFAVYDPDAETVDVVDNDSHHHGGDKSPPNVVAETGAETLICGNLGGKAAERFDAMGIDVYCDADGTVGDAIEALRDGELTPVGPDDDGCDHEGGGHHDEDGGHGHGGGGHSHSDGDHDHDGDDHHDV